MTVTRAKLPVTFPKGWLWGVPMVLGVIAIGVPKYAAACDEKKICVKYTTNEFQDNGSELGSVPLGTPVTDPDTEVTQWLVDATGVRVTIIRPPPEPPLGMHLDEDGCVEFPTQFSAGHQVVVHPDALVGIGQDVRVTVHDWNGESSSFETFDVSDDNLLPKAGDSCEIPPIADGMEVQCSPPEYDWWAIMAVATHFVNKFDSLPGSPLSGEDLDFAFMYGAPGFGFYRSDLRNLALGVGTARHRFLVAHEMGHWIHSRLQVAEEGPPDLGVQYSYPAACHHEPTGPSPACEFAVVYEQPDLTDLDQAFLKGELESHGIRSSEYSNGAMVEGFAHFAAAAAFNDISEENGEFTYYKDIDSDAVPAYEDFVTIEGYRVELPDGVSGLGGTTAWVESQCTEDWNTEFGDEMALHPTAVSSEIDWLRFFWEFLTLQDAPQPEFWEVPLVIAHALKYDENPWSGTVCTNGDFTGEMRVWEPLINTLTSDPGNAGLDAYLERFEGLNDTHKVFHDPS